VRWSSTYLCQGYRIHSASSPRFLRFRTEASLRGSAFGRRRCTRRCRAVRLCHAERGAGLAASHFEFAAMDRIAKLAGTTMEVAGTLTEKTKALSQEAINQTGTIVERTGGALAEAKDVVQRVEARADEAILTSMDRIGGLRGSTSRSDSPGSGGESNDITEQPAYSPPTVEAERGGERGGGGGGGLSRFTGEALEAATSVGRTSMSMLRREPAPEPAPEPAAGGYSTRSWSDRAAEADAPLGGRGSRTDPDIEPAHSPPSDRSKKKGTWWKGGRGDDEPDLEQQQEDMEDEYGERKGLLSGVGDVSGRVANATAQKARAAGQKVGLVEKPPETLLEQVQSELPSLKKKTRVKSFALCFSLGCCLMMFSTVFIPTIMVAPGPFARTYSMGNLLMMTATFCIVGPRRQCKSCFQTKRILTSIVFLASLGGTLYFAFTGESILVSA
jgi:hypothetical protein